MESMNDGGKTLIHISHLHPLSLVAFASPELQPICHACNMQCADESYGCVDCNYFLHTTCATTPRSMNHPSHPAHTLKLELTPPYMNGRYYCNGCGVDGTSFVLRCGECKYDLHLHCAAIPTEVNHTSHHHPLTLFKHTKSIDRAKCSLCKMHFDSDKWFYYCTCCDVGGHVECFSLEKLEVLSPSLQAPPPSEQSQSETNLIELQNRMMQIQLQSMMIETQRRIIRGYKI